ncbi:MAG: hypothetical protein GY768_00860 [Planctomycetaceae bacterium]|nr:hypothetical protein [Planctomycetaceae bacterium]
MADTLQKETHTSHDASLLPGKQGLSKNASSAPDERLAGNLPAYPCTQTIIGDALLTSSERN